MSFDISYPSITALNNEGKLEQIRSYLYQLADQLKWALNSMSGDSSKVLNKGEQSQAKELSPEEAQATFKSVKSLIISSAEVIDAYYDVINSRLEGEYVAQSDFGTYSEKTTQDIIQNSTSIEQVFSNIQKITTDLDNIASKLIDVTAHIKSGLLYYDADEVPIYGLEIGQINTIDGREVFNKYARFTADKLSFYDKNDTEVAYISDYKLYITNARITGTLTLGRYDLDPSDGLAVKWV